MLTVDDSFLVIDDFADDRLFARIRSVFRTEWFAYRSRIEAEPVLRFFSGNPLRGDTHVYSIEEMQAESDVDRGDSPALLELARAVYSQRGRISPIVGCAGTDWHALSLCPTMFPSGTSHGWHTDGDARTGACIFYSNEVWEPDWGGELLIRPGTPPDHVFATLSTERIRNRSVTNRFSNDLESDYILDAVGYAVHPVRNRLCLLRGQQYHTIARVTAAAGNHVRCAISGFFLTAKGKST